MSGGAEVVRGALHPARGLLRRVPGWPDLCRGTVPADDEPGLWDGDQALQRGLYPDGCLLWRCRVWAEPGLSKRELWVRAGIPAV